MLAFSTISHAGIMLIAIGLGGPLAFAAMLVYLLGHAFTKGGLFLTSGILLHRLRAIGERSLFTKGRALPWTATLWFLGAIGLAAAPPFLLMAGEAGISQASEGAASPWISWVCLIGGMLTSAAVLRVGMHTFFGWGIEPITDEAAEVGELPETASEDQKIFWYQYAPAAICTGIPVLLLATGPAWLRTLCSAGATFARQQAMLHLVYAGAQLPAQSAEWFAAFRASAVRGTLALLLAALLACTSVFRSRLKRSLRIGPFLESGFRPLRSLQSGHPGDYVLWLTIGLACIGAINCFYFTSEWMFPGEIQRRINSPFRWV
jgi:multicomponent Na+:H+ antiporter subunit D